MIKSLLMGVFVIYASTLAGSEINIISLPAERWMDYRDLRLKALTECPEAFGIAASDEEDRTVQEWQDSYIGGGKWFVFAECKGKLIGMLGAETPCGSHMQHVVEIIRGYVDPQYRKHGVFRLLYASLKEHLKKEPKLEQMIVWTMRFGPHENWVEQVYEKLGFEFCGLLPNIVKIDENHYECSWLTASLKK